MDNYYNISDLNNCYDNGNLISNGTHGWCNCDIAFFNFNCSEKGIDSWNKAFLFYKLLYTTCYILIAGFTWLHLLKELLKEHGVCRLLCRLLQSPKYMVIFNLIMISTSIFIIIQARSVYVSVDPFRQLNIFPRIIDLILYENIFSVTFSIFLVLLLVWTGLYSAFNIDSMEEGFVRKKDKSLWEKYKYNIIHTIVLVILLFVYPLQIAFSYVRGSRNLDPLYVGWALAGGFLFLVLFIIMFAYYTIKFKKALSNNYSKSQKDINHLMKASTRSYNLINNRFGKNKVESIISPKTSKDDTRKVHIEFLLKLKEQHLLKFFLKNVYSGIESKLNDSLSDSEFETEMVNIIDDDYKSAEIGLMQVNKSSTDSHERPIEEIENIEQKQEREFEFTYRLSHEDMIVLHNIVTLSLVIILISLGIILFGILMLFTSVLSNKTGTLILMYISSFFEIIGFFFVFQLFVREIKSSEYENLKIIGDIENFLKDNKNRTKKLVFSDINKTTIYNRFKNFMNLNSTNTKDLKSTETQNEK